MADMSPEKFITLWKGNELTERAGAQAHFDDLCDLLGVDKPRDPNNYCFERGARKSGGGDGWADVWKQGCFGWENKKPGRDLTAALKQLTDYALQLDNPPLLVVSDRERIVIHTAFTGYPDEPREIRIEELTDPGKRQLLHWVFTDPEKLRPEKSTAAITEEAAGRFARLAKLMRERGLDGQRTAHFLGQCLFCLFAEDEKLLPGNIFTDLLKNAGNDPERAARRIEKLFTAMRDPGGEYGDYDIAWFNGGLFKTIDIPPLSQDDLAALYQAAGMDWRAIDPTVFGTLFERGLDPSSRAPLGAHYTDTGTIAKLIRPLITEPLLREWREAKAVIAAGEGKGERSAEAKAAKAAFEGFLQRLNRFRVLDPACGSGNFLYLALKALRDVEKQVLVEAHDLGCAPGLWLQTGPHNILGIEINEYAAELARVTVWIGDIQWCRRNGREIATQPILRPLDSIAHRDALLNPDGSEAAWPEADVVVGNPPFLGTKKQWGELGRSYTDRLRNCYEGRVPGFADLVCYWFEIARAQIAAGKLQAAGLVATNSICGGANRKVLDRICDSTRIFNAWSDEPWVNEGAAVRVSLIAFGKLECEPALDGQTVSVINPDLTSGAALTKARQLTENVNCAFVATVKAGPFDIPGDLARAWLSKPNPHGRPNRDVVRPWANGMDVTRRPSDTWIIDFGVGLPLAEAMLFEEPFQHVNNAVAGQRNASTKETKYKNWWLMARPIPAMRKALQGLTRCVVTPVVAKHRLFAWMDTSILADHQLIVIARSDDATFGILHSRFHELWSLRLCTWLGVGNDPRYTPTTTFETFPFPAGLTPRDTAAGAPATPVVERIASAACRLNELRENWLNPPEWVDWVITPEEEKAGFPRRPVAKPGHEVNLKKRTLTNLYNARPAWLDLAHRDLDRAVAAAYGWDDYAPEMADEEILRRLLALNLERTNR